MNNEALAEDGQVLWDAVVAAGFDTTLTDTRVKRIKMRMAEIGMHQEQLALAVGITPSSVSLMINRKSRRSRHLPQIASALGVNLAWLLGDTDERVDMRDIHGNPITEIDLPRLMKDAAFVADRVKTVRDDTSQLVRLDVATDMVPIREIDLGAIEQSDQPSPRERPRYFSREVLRMYSAAEPRFLMFAQGIGDSMMPTIMDADTVLIDTSQKSLKVSDKLWAINLYGVGMVKRLRPAHGGVKIISDNPAIGDDIAAEEDIAVLGRVVGIFRKV